MSKPDIYHPHTSSNLRREQTHSIHVDNATPEEVFAALTDRYGIAQTVDGLSTNRSMPVEGSLLTTSFNKVALTIEKQDTTPERQIGITGILAATVERVIPGRLVAIELLQAVDAVNAPRPTTARIAISSSSMGSEVRARLAGTMEHGGSVGLGELADQGPVQSALYGVIHRVLDEIPATVAERQATQESLRTAVSTVSSPIETQPDEDPAIPFDAPTLSTPNGVVKTEGGEILV